MFTGSFSSKDFSNEKTCIKEIVESMKFAKKMFRFPLDIINIRKSRFSKGVFQREWSKPILHIISPCFLMILKGKQCVLLNSVQEFIETEV